ncbi:hypothetical protein JXA63_00035 [Candidatus Woesebacteria bacterium]|nr:hypothetical protein [Candidatus Woesebacteria bacterium]
MVKVKKGILFYTDPSLKNEKLKKLSRKTIKASGLPITCVSLRENVDMGGKNLTLHGYRSHTTLYTQILLGLLVSEAKYIFFCEHDCLYHKSHFDFTPPTDKKYYYNNNVYKYRLSDRKVVGYDCNWLSQLCANRDLLISHYTKRFKRIAAGKRAYGYEPGTGQSRLIERTSFERFESKYPNLDVRHGDNWTGTKRMDPKEFRDKSTCQNFKVVDIEKIPGWDTKVLKSI